VLKNDDAHGTRQQNNGDLPFSAQTKVRSTTPGDHKSSARRLQGTADMAK